MDCSNRASCVIQVRPCCPLTPCLGHTLDHPCGLHAPITPAPNAHVVHRPPRRCPAWPLHRPTSHGLSTPHSLMLTSCILATPLVRVHVGLRTSSSYTPSNWQAFHLLRLCLHPSRLCMHLTSPRLSPHRHTCRHLPKIDATLPTDTTSISPEGPLDPLLLSRTHTRLE